MNTSGRIRATLAVAAVASTLAWSGLASAASGYVNGQIKFWQKQGNYCPSFRDCTGSNYLESAYDTAQPVAEVQIQVVDAANTSTVLGQGSTDASGNYLIAWSTAGAPPSAKILWKARHKDSRFEVVSASTGGIYYFTSTSFSLTSGTTAGSPQALSTYTFGSSGSPSAVANLYDGAWRTWHYALSYSGLMSSLFTGVKIRAFDASSCPTSCAIGSTKTITIDSTDSAFSPQGRIMHEMGHIASYLAKPFVATAAYAYPNSCTGCGGWSFDSEEWKSASFEEGLATFIGDVAMYWYWAPEPMTCLSSSYCSSWSIEETTGDGNCVAGEDRWAISTERYLWDVYDTVDDANTYDVVNISYWQFFTTLNNYPTGFGANQNDEPWSDESYTTVDNYDGRDQEDFLMNLWDAYDVLSLAPALDNCVP